MATTKALLEASMKRLGSRGAMPDDNSAIEILKESSVTQEGSGWNLDVLKYTTPCDGFFQARIVSSSDESSVCVRNNSLNVYGTGKEISVCIPAIKGSILAFDVKKVNGSIMYYNLVQFFKSVGGG